MDNELIKIDKEDIKRMIYTVRGIQIMLDFDLAKLYEVKTKRLNEQVRRNMERFPESFMFKLTRSERDELVAKCDHLKPLKFSSAMPFAFTEQGVAMLSAVLKSYTAIKVSVEIIEAFVTMRKFLLTNAQLFQRLDKTEQKLLEHDDKFKRVFSLIEDKSIKPDKGIFFDGQVFDAHRFISDLIRTANKSIVLIDNYIDDSVLALLGKRNKDVQAMVFTREISKQLSLDLTKYNSQYPPIKIKELKQSHDRFLIIDNKDMYHFGASLKDLGKKWFAFSKFGKEAFRLLDKLGLK